MKPFIKDALGIALALYAGVVLVTGCGGEKPAQQPTPPAVTETAPTASAQSQAEETTTWLTRVKFKAADGSEALSIKRYADHDKIELSFDGTTGIFKGRTDRADRVKYREEEGEAAVKKLVAEVKIKEDSIKLVDEKEALLWKVKFNDDKVKISNNEDGNDSCEIKVKSSDKGEIRDSAGNEIGNVRFYSDNGKLKVKDAAGSEVLVTKDCKFSLAPGVILFKHIPLQHRAVIISEILRRGR